MDELKEELVRKMDALQREYERKMHDAQSVTSRMRDDFDLKYHTEVKKREEMESFNSTLSEEITSRERRLKREETDLMDLKNKAESGPNARLQVEVSSLRGQKANLEKRAEQVKAESKSAKSKLLKAYQELAHFKQEQATTAQAQQQKDQQELEVLRLHAIASRHSQLLNNEKGQLRTLKHELDQLTKESSQEMQTNTPPFKGNQQFGNEQDGEESEHQQKIQQLMKERDKLLKTGLYSASDKVIRMIDKAIDESSKSLNQLL